MQRGGAATLTIVVCLLVSTLGACRDGDPRSDVAPLHIGDGDFTTRVAYQGDAVLTFADLNVCLNGDTTAELLSLTAVGPTEDSRVSDFDVVTVTQGSYADYARPLDRIGSWTSHRRLVSTECSEGAGPSLAIELSKETPRAEFPSFLLTYRSGDEEYEAPVEFPVAVCTDLKGCSPPDP